MSFTTKQKVLLNQNIRKEIRSFFIAHNYLEADAPILVPWVIPESYLDPFETQLRSPGTADRCAYLTASPEAYLKRLLSAGLDNSVYYLGKAFRNDEPMGRIHSHEFTLLEWYQLRGNYQTLMKETEELVRAVALGLHSNLSNKPFCSITVHEAFRTYAHTDVFTLDEDSYNRHYVADVEPHLGFETPTFLIDFPSWTSPLAKASMSSEHIEIAQRFELYMNGVELVNGWTELTDWKKQKENLDIQEHIRHQWRKPHVTADSGFIDALKENFPKCAGAALGVDRLLMVLCNAQLLSDVVPFTTGEIFKT